MCRMMWSAGNLTESDGYGKIFLLYLVVHLFSGSVRFVSFLTVPLPIYIYIYIDRYKAPVAHTLCILVLHIVSLLYDVTICIKICINMLQSFQIFQITRLTRKGRQHLSAKSLDSGLSRSVHPTEKTCSLLSLCPMGLVEESSGQLQVTHSNSSDKFSCISPTAKALLLLISKPSQRLKIS